MATTFGMARRAVSAAAAAAAAAATGTPTPKRVLSVEKITARVFCPRPQRELDAIGSNRKSSPSLPGGNPVTIFAAPEQLSGPLQKRLAETCEWESVVVRTTDNNEPSSPTMSFFMPSGEEVSFCAHAAIGGAIAMGRESSYAASAASWNFRSSMTGDSFRVDRTSGKEEDTGDNKALRSFSCCLQMTGVAFEEEPLSAAATNTLAGWSRRLGWMAKANSNNPDGSTTTTARNASVARPKTLVELESVETLHRALAPLLPSPSDSDPSSNFTEACTAMDDSTGVYVYAPLSLSLSPAEDGMVTRDGSTVRVRSYECRQFPRASGYPEDPATGIAAAALAASLRFGNGNDGEGALGACHNFDVYQGTAMGRPSLIQVVDLRRANIDADTDTTEAGSHGPNSIATTAMVTTTTISFGLQGLVEIDDRCTIEVSD